MSRTDDRLDGIKKNTEEIKNKLDPPTDGSWIFSAIILGIGSLGRPFRRLLPDEINSIIDIIGGITCLIGFIFAIISSFNDFTGIGNYILMFIVGMFLMASSPCHDKKK